MSILDRAKEALAPEPVKPPKDVLAKVRRAHDRMLELAPVRNLCWEFFRGNQYALVTHENKLQATATSISIRPGEGRPPHRQRTTRNILRDPIAHEVSAATQRVPAFRVSATSTDPEDVSAAQLSQKVAYYGYDKWGFRKVGKDVVTSAVVADEGFAWAYFDNTKGACIDEETGVCEGEVCIRTYTSTEVGWEPGCRFEDSPYHIVVQARPVSAVESMPGFTGPPLTPDAATSEALGSDRKKGKEMVLVTEYLEKPCRAYKHGRRLTLANGRVILPAEPYPPTGLRKLSYINDPDSDHDIGLVRDAIDAQRTYNDSWNKSLEWKRLALNPQVILKNMSFQDGQRLTDEPGAVYTAFGSGDALWRPVPQIPPELQQQRSESIDFIARLFAQNDIPNQVDTGKGVQELFERDAQRRASFLADLAEFYAHLMRDCLVLVQRHYTEDRLLRLRGRDGAWTTVKDFRGAQLKDQTDVWVAPSSIEPRTRESIEKRIMGYAQLQWISPEKAMAAIESGTGADLLDAYEDDLNWGRHIVELIKGVGDGSTRPDQIPEARPFDNVPVILSVLESFLKSEDFAYSPEPVREVAQLVWETYKQTQADQQAQEAAQQIQTAQALGMSNAAKPTTASMPSQPESGMSAPGGTPAN